MTPPPPLRTACSKLFLLDKSVSAFPRWASSRIFSASVKRKRADTLLGELIGEVTGPALVKGEAHVDVGHQCTFSIALGILRKTRL